MEDITVQILIATLMLAVSNLWAQAPMVSDISYSQTTRPGRQPYETGRHTI